MGTQPCDTVFAGGDPARGISASENRVARLCSQERIWSIFAKKRGLNRRSGPPIHDDLVQRQFSAQTANQVWALN
ncbi:hypothetical protein MAHJHV47_46120 [Mycobacterium avium subsp. hominissuis]